MKDLQGKVSLVTGGSRGIGRAIVNALSDAGADVAFTYRRICWNGREPVTGWATAKLSIR